MITVTSMIVACAVVFTLIGLGAAWGTAEYVTAEGVSYSAGDVAMPFIYLPLGGLVMGLVVGCVASFVGVFLGRRNSEAIPHKSCKRDWESPVNA
jgi:hypothetical protein